MSVSRGPARRHMGDLLTAALVGEDKPADAVYAYQVYDIESQSKVAFISSGPIVRRDFGYGGDLCRTEIILEIHLLVLYSDIQSGWTDEDSEDALDEMETIVADVVQANTRTDYWSVASYGEDGVTLFDPPTISGKVYKHEVIPIRMEVFE